MTPELAERELDFALDAGRRRLALEFGANAREYFHLWIENLVLDVLTLGLYSPACVLGAAALVAPWVVVRSLRFNARCSAACSKPAHAT